MNAARAQAYGRFIRAVDSAYPDVLTHEQQQVLREVADAMVFARSPEEWELDAATRRARVVLLDLLDAPGSEWWVDRVTDDLEQIGPAAAERTLSAVLA